MQLSHYQESLLSFVASGKGHGLVNAVAGSGKTSTLVLAAQYLPSSQNAMFLAFGKEIANTLNDKLAGTSMRARTIHSLSFEALRGRLPGIKVEERKYAKLASQWVRDHEDEWKDDELQPARAIISSSLKKLVDFTRLTLTDPRDWSALWKLADRFGIQVYAPIIPAVSQIIKYGTDHAFQKREVDFTDMMYLSLHLKANIPQFDFLGCDEAQDNSALLTEFILKACAPGGRMLFIGDRNQSIFGFAGAMLDSMDHIQRMTDAQALPLSVCYRCPTTHIALVKGIVPQIESPDWMHAGSISIVHEAQLPVTLQPGDVVLCRLNAPLISLCLKLIAKKIPAKVRGRNVAEQLVDTIIDVSQLRDFRFEDFLTFLGVWHQHRIVELDSREASDSAYEALQDRVDGIVACWQAFQPETIKSFQEQIDNLFTNGPAAITLSSGHRFKGQEAKRVFLLRPELMDKSFGKKAESAEDAQQRLNLKYVMLTRSMDELYFVESPK